MPTLLSKRSLPRAFVFATISGLSLCAVPASAISAGSPSVDDFLHLRTIYESGTESVATPRSGVALSPDGRWLASFSDIASERKLEGRRLLTTMRLTITDLSTGKSIDLTSSGTGYLFPQWSPDGTKLAYIDYDAEGMHLHVWDSATRHDRRLTDALLYGNRLLSWSPDGRTIIASFVKPGISEQDVTQAYSGASNQSQETVKKTAIVYTIPAKGAAAGAAPRSFREAYRENVLPGHRKLYVGAVDVATGEILPLTKRGIETIGFVSPVGDRLAYLDIDDEIDGKWDLWTAPLADGAPLRVESGTKIGNYGHRFRWSPDGKWLAYSSDALSGTYTPDEGAYMVPTDGKGERRLLSGGLFTDVQWSPDGTGLLLVGDPDPAPADKAVVENAKVWSQQRGRATPGLWHYDLRTKALRRITPKDWAYRARALQFAPDQNGYWSPDGGRTALFTARDPKGFSDSFWKANLVTGTVTRLHDCEGFCDSAGISSDGRRLVFTLSNGKPEDLWLTDASFRQPPRRVTHLNPGLENRRYGESKVVEYVSRQGRTLPMSLVLPVGYQPGRRYPMIISLYPSDDPYGYMAGSVRRFNPGGDSFTVHLNAQLFASRGYVVAYLTPPQRYGTPMKDIADAVSPAIDKAIAMGIADPKRIGIYGHSYGGYSVLSTIVQEPRIAAAVDSAGAGGGSIPLMAFSMGHDLTNRFTMGRSWPTGQGKMSGPFWGNKDEWFANSPLYQLDKATAPLLILQGAVDTATPREGSNAVFAAMRSLGKTVEYRIYPEGNHVLKGEDDIDAVKATMRWFDTYLKGAPSQHAAATPSAAK